MSTKLAPSFPAAKGKKKKTGRRTTYFSKTVKEHILKFFKRDTLPAATKVISNSTSK